MDGAVRHGAAILRRVLLLLALGGAASLVACGGGGDTAAPAGPSGPTGPTAPTSVVTGTAASGAALANMLVTLKDSTNKAVTATSSTSGAFTLDSSNLTPPFLLQVSLPSGTRLLSVSADANKTTTINITPLTDVVVRSWYALNGQSADSAFTNPVSLPPPNAAQVKSLVQVLVNNLQLAIGANGAPVSAPEDLISKPFAADGSGMDKLLDHTRVTLRSGGIELVLTAGTATQTTALSFSTTTASITANSTTVNGTITTTSQSTDVVPVQGAQLTALDEIKAALTSLAGVISSKGAALTATDLEPFFDASLVNQGQDRAETLADIVAGFRQGQSASIVVERLRSLDAAAGLAQVDVKITETLAGASRDNEDTFFLRKGTDGKWRFFGDGRIANVSLQAEGRSSQGLFSGSANCANNCAPHDGPAVNLDARARLGTVTSVAATSTFAIPAFTRGATDVSDSGQQFDTFFSNTGPLGGTLPAAGTPVNITLQKSGGGSVTYTLPLNAFTTELIRITTPAPTTTSVRAGTVTVAWTRPTTYAVKRVELNVQAFTGDQTQGGGFQCNSDKAFVAATATSGTVTIPTQCNGQPVVQADINVATEGANGERSLVIHAVNVTP